MDSAGHLRDRLSAFQFAALGGAILIGSLGGAWVAERSGVALPWKVADPRVPVSRLSTSATPIAGRRLALVYIGSSSCAWCAMRESQDAIATVVERLQRRAGDEGIEFIAIGVARDYDLPSGLRHLGEVGGWDEIVVGQGHLNLGIRKYVLGVGASQLATPQLVLVEQEIIGQGTSLEVDEEEVLLRRVGLGQILGWLEAGLPVPDR